MATPHLLIIEDDEDIQELLEYNFRLEGYRVSRAATGESGLETARREKPDLIILDLMLPGLNGLDVCRSLKANSDTRSIAILMLTAKGEESDIVVGLELGADDYVTKPFSLKVLLARIRAVLRRKTEPGEEKVRKGDRPLEIKDLTIHPGRREVRLKGQLVDLTTTEFNLLHFLIKRPGWVYTRQQIIDAVWGEDHFITDRAVDVQVVGLRKKLGDAGQNIETVRGVGYRFRE